MPIVKIDVEGHELQVLQGLSETLTDQGLRGVFTGVNFSVLLQSGLPHAPAVIEQMPRAAGFETS